MMRYWFGGQTDAANSVTRFSGAEEFKQIIPLISQLKAKSEALKKAKDTKGLGTIDYVKWEAVSQLVTRLDDKINEFNALSPLADAAAEKQAKIMLCNDLYLLLRVAKLRHEDVFNTYRDGGRMALRSVTAIGVGVGAVAAAATVPLSFFGSGIITYFATASAGDKVRKTFGWSQRETQTLLIIQSLMLTLSKVMAAMRFSLGDARAFNQDLFLREGNERGLEHLVSPPDLRSNNQDARPVPVASAIPVQSIVDVYHPATEDYIDKMRENITKDGKNADIVMALELSDEEEKLFAGLTDVVTLEVFNLPVLLNGRLYELDSLLSIQPDADGARKDPANRYLFYPRDLQPAWDITDKIHQVIAGIRQKRQADSAAVTVDENNQRISRP